MRTFEVDDDLVELVWKMANPEPFESLSFSEALRRVLKAPVADNRQQKGSGNSIADILAGRVPTGSKKAQSPSAKEWVEKVSELKGVKGLDSWKDVCDHLDIDPAGDSARRKLKVWVGEHRPTWPKIPEPQ